MDNYLKNKTRLIRKDIILHGETGFVTGDATDYWEEELAFNSRISPKTVELYARRVLGTATWAGSIRIALYLYRNNAYEEVASGESTGNDPYQETIDLSSITSGKYYTKMKIRYGGVSSDGTTNHIGQATIKTYKR